MNTCEENTFLLIDAVEQGDIAKVQRLILTSEPAYNDSQALRVAARCGLVECLIALIPFSDPKANDSHALRLAAQYGHAACVQILIPISDPKARESRALQFASEYGHIECMNLLYDVSDPVIALEILKYREPGNYGVWGNLEQRVEATRLSNVLNHNICETTIVKPIRKI